MAQPNILIFFTDQQRWDACGCYGQPLPVTPHLDQMAGEPEPTLLPQPNTTTDRREETRT